MTGRAIFIALASVAVVATPPLGTATGGSSGQPAAQAATFHSASNGLRLRAPSNLPTGCTHGGGRFHRKGPAHPKRIAIGFDDGPGDYTPKVLRVLREFDSHATFFEIGQEIPGHEEVMKRILAQGNEIGNHSLHHEIDPSASSLAETDRLIRHATGFTPCDFRPPDGRTNDALIERAHREGLVTITWDVDPRDWADPGTAAIASNVIRNARSGAIVVMHDGSGNRSQTVAALPAILSHFRDRGYKFVTVAELLGHTFTY